MTTKRLLGWISVCALVAVAPGAAAQKKGRDAGATAARIVGSVAPVHEGDVVLVTGGVDDADLLQELDLQLRKRGAFGLLFLNSSPGMARRYWSEVPAKYDSQVPRADIQLATMADLAISVDSDSAEVGALADVPAERRQARGNAFRIVSDLMRARKVAMVNLGNGLYPGPNNAARYGLSPAELAQIFWDSVSVDPARIVKSNQGLMAALAAGKELEITHPNGTSLKMRVEGRKVFSSDGTISEEERAQGGPSAQVWLPAGEVYLVPVPGTAEGVIVDERYVGSSLGKEIQGLTLTFHEGRLASMKAKTPMDWLQKDYDAAPAGKELFGVIDFGTNPALRAGKGKLESWVAAGTVSYMIGDNSWAGGDNNVNFAIAGQLQGCTVKLDGKLLVENGALK